MSTNNFFRSERWPKLVIALSVIISSWAASNIYWGKQHYTGIIKSDGKGYYAYLPATFIYYDLNFRWVDSIEYIKYHNPNYFFDFRNQYKGRYIDKYYVGTAICMAPFFGLAHALTVVSGGDADGYSRWYQLSAHWAALFWLLVALWAMNAFLRDRGYRANMRAWTLIFIYFGTNWFYYVVGEPSMSHAYSVGLIALFVYFLNRWLSLGVQRYLLWACLLMGWIFITRPVNVLMGGMLFPLAGDWDLIKKRLFSIHRNLPFGGGWLLPLTTVVMIIPQMLIYKVQTGHWWIYAYQDEGFDFLNPEWLNLLFSYQKGFFIYTPLALLALFGWWPIFKENQFRAISLLLLLATLVYVFSSWWNWFYGGSFSQRVFVDVYVVFAWLLAASMEYFISITKRRLWIALLGVFLLFNQFQIYQYRYNLIHWSEMNKTKYWEVFLKWP